MPSAAENTPSLKWRFAQWLERRWWRNYLRHQSAEQYLADKRAYWEKVLEQFAHEAVAGERVLDAGCGPAGIFILLHDRQRVTALDPLLDQYAADLEIFHPDDYPGVNFIPQPLETATSLATTYRTIYCFNAVNHVNDWELALDRLTGWAAPGTTLLLSSDVHRRPWLKAIFRLLPGDLLHPQQHDRTAYREALQQRGWSIEKELLLRRERIFDYVGWKVSRP